MLMYTVGHPLIHLGYAYELASRDLAMEALGMASSCYNYLHKYSDDQSYSRSTCYGATTLRDIFDRVAADDRFDNLFDHKGGNNFENLFKNHEDLVLEYWNSWRLDNPLAQFQESQSEATILLAGTQGIGKTDNAAYDFFLVHALTTSHAARIILPYVPSKQQVLLIRQWWLLTLAVYISQLRPRLDQKSIVDFGTQGKDWDHIVNETQVGKWSTDAHFVKAIRALKEAAKTWGDTNQFYLKAAVKFCGQFNGWSGFD